MDQAMHHYTRAKSIVDIVSGMGKIEQEEINKNKVRPLLTIVCHSALRAYLRFPYHEGLQGTVLHLPDLEMPPSMWLSWGISQYVNRGRHAQICAWTLDVREAGSRQQRPLRTSPKASTCPHAPNQV